MATIRLEKVSKLFKRNTVLRDISLEIADGECTVLVGPSGCGKSTLLRVICGLEECSSGELFIDNECVNDIPASRRGLTMVFQSYALYPHMTVFENMAFALKIQKLSKNEIEERVLNAANILKIKNLLDRKPGELSGGQRQRVAIGRCIVRNPSAFLFDEPLSNLDASLRHEMRYELGKLKAQLKTTMVYVTHDQEEAMTLADKIVVMRDGNIEQVGSPLDVYNKPVNTFVASFIGSPTINFINATVQSYDEKYVYLELCSGDIIQIKNRYNHKFNNDNVILGIRPNNVFIDKVHAFSNEFVGTVSFVENLGNTSYTYLSISNGQIINAQTNGHVIFNPDDKVKISIDEDRAYLFAEDGKLIA